MTRSEPGSVERVTRNVAWMSFSQTFTWSLALVLALVLPRHLGPAAVGRLFLAQSLWALAGVVVAFGTGTLITKAVARRRDDAAMWTGRGLAVRCALLVLAWPAVIGFLVGFGYEREQVHVAAVIGVSSSLAALASVGRVVLQGLEELAAVSVVDMVAKASLVIVVLVLVASDVGVVLIAAAWVVAGAVGLGGMAIATRRHAGPLLRPTSAMLVPTLTLAVPYVLFDVSRVLYQQVDTVVISLLVGDATVGWYSTADQIYSSAFFLAAVVLAAAFPALARLPDRPAEVRSDVLSESVVFTLAAAVALGVGLWAVGPEVATVVFGDDFAPTGEALRVFGVALVPTYLSTLFGHVALAFDRQALWTRLLVGAALGTVVLDIVLVPWAERRWENGAIGGALSYVVTEVVIVSLGLWRLRLGLRRRLVAVDGAKILVAGAVMAAALWSVADLPLPVRVVAGALAYGAAAVALGLLHETRRDALRAAARGLRTRKTSTRTGVDA